jgi:hypothetical protein
VTGAAVIRSKGASVVSKGKVESGSNRYLSSLNGLASYTSMIFMLHTRRNNAQCITCTGRLNARVDSDSVTIALV